LLLLSTLDNKPLKETGDDFHRENWIDALVFNKRGNVESVFHQVTRGRLSARFGQSQAPLQPCLQLANGLGGGDSSGGVHVS
jgi:hypothetical protein